VTQLFTFGKTPIYFGNKYEAEAHYDWGLMVCLLGHSFAPSGAPVKVGKATLDRYPSLTPLADFQPSPFMTVDWPDGGVPPFQRKWWEGLRKALEEVKGDVVIFCQGGHGRTGTAASILAGMEGLTKKGCPVRWVRKHYCTKAVETTAQINYISEILGIKVKEQGSYVTAKAAQASTSTPAKGAEGSSTQGSLNVAGQEWVRDPHTGLMMRKGELDQDWNGSHWEV
jgi:hypothetical protein